MLKWSRDTKENINYFKFVTLFRYNHLESQNKGLALVNNVRDTTSLDKPKILAQPRHRIKSVYKVVIFIHYFHDI